jgi:hypothetical protein
VQKHPHIPTLARIAVILAAVVAAAACASEHDSASDRDATKFRCRDTLPDGSCESRPANCPVTIPHGNVPSCPVSTELIPIEEDDCTHKFICID